MVLEQEALIQLLEADCSSLPDRLRLLTRERSDDPFLFYGETGRTLTFGQFDEESNRLANGCRRFGLGAGARVAVFSYNALMTAVSMVATWKMGAIYCPINFQYRGRLLAQQLNDLCADAIVIDQRLVSALSDVISELSESGTPPLSIVYCPSQSDHDYDPLLASMPLSLPGTLVTFTAVMEAGTSEEPGVGISPYDIANIFYTSGTTGSSKGVLQTHRWVNHHTYRTRSLLTSEDVMYNDLPMYHVGGAIAAFGAALWAGARLALWDRFSTSEFWRRVATSGATTTHLVDVMIPWLMSRPAALHDAENGLNKVFMQPLPSTHREVAERFGFDFVFSGFGQTESSVGCNIGIEERSEGTGTPAALYRGYNHSRIKELCDAHGFLLLSPTDAVGTKPLGMASRFVEAAVLGEQDEECPVGDIGELCFRPKIPGLLFQGYFRRDEATVKAWRNLWFHTGDLALRDTDGLFYFVDRRGDRIRRRGENISSSELESLIREHPGVAVVAAVAIPEVEGEEDDIAVFVLPAEGAVVSEADISAWSKKQLPKFMHPDYIRVVTELPMTPTNKIEKYKLKAELLADLDGRD